MKAFRAVLLSMLVCPVVLVCLSACTSAAPTRTRAPSLAEIARMITPTPTPTTPADEPDRRETKQLVLRALARLALLRSYRARVVDEAGRTQALLEYVRPDRYRQITETEMKEQIAIGDVLYSRTGEGPWVKQEWPAIGRLMNEATIPQRYIWDVADQGEEPVEGIRCHRVQVTLRVGDTQLTDVYWIGVEDRLPHKIITQVDEQTTLTKLLYDFNQDFQIEPPIAE